MTGIDAPRWQRFRDVDRNRSRAAGRVVHFTVRKFRSSRRLPKIFVQNRLAFQAADAGFL